MSKAKVCTIVAMDENQGIGKDNKLPWHLSADLKRFKKLTMGHPVILGRKTYESILGYLNKPLPGRTSIVVTRDKDYDPQFENVHVVHSIEEAIKLAQSIDDEEIFIGGGTQIIKLAMPFVERLYLTIIHKTFDVDAYFPDYSMFTKKLHEETHSEKDLEYTWVTLER